MWVCAVWAVVSVCPLRAEQLYPSLAKVGEEFSFVINADPQIGPPDSKADIERNLHQLLKDFVREWNGAPKRPAFVLYDGDLVAYDRPAYFAAFRDVVKEHNVPVALVHGNHDGGFGDPHFLDVQQVVSGFRRLYYSFNCGRWHFVVLPCPEIVGEQGEGPMLRWLAEDLRASKDRPTMVFLHYHLLPVGLSQCEYYTMPMSFKRALLEAFARHGNVRHVVSGHVHAGIKSSIKTSWSYKGTNYIVAPSPVPPRSFGE